MPSIVHGSAIIEPFVNIINQELAAFVNGNRIGDAATNLEEKAVIFGIR